MLLLAHSPAYKSVSGKVCDLIYTGLGKTNGGDREDACL